MQSILNFPNIDLHHFKDVNRILTWKSGARKKQGYQHILLVVRGDFFQILEGTYVMLLNTFRDR